VPPGRRRHDATTALIDLLLRRLLVRQTLGGRPIAAPAPPHPARQAHRIESLCRSELNSTPVLLGARVPYGGAPRRCHTRRLPNPHPMLAMTGELRPHNG
jgi:hypothetical protein